MSISALVSASQRTQAKIVPNSMKIKLQNDKKILTLKYFQEKNKLIFLKKLQFNAKKYDRKDGKHRRLIQKDQYQTRKNLESEQSREKKWKRISEH